MCGLFKEVLIWKERRWWAAKHHEHSWRNEGKDGRSDWVWLGGMMRQRDSGMETHFSWVFSFGIQQLKQEEKTTLIICISSDFFMVHVTASELVWQMFL